MGNIFSGSEIVEIGVQIEKNGKDFYNTVAAQSKDEKARQIFVYLAEQEDKHIEVFQKILSDVKQYDPAESYPGEYSAYMNALASEHIFSKKDQGVRVAKNTSGDKQAVELGMSFEKDSIIFYEGMKKAVPSSEHKLIEELIKQEQAHLTQLTEFKKLL